MKFISYILPHLLQLLSISVNSSEFQEWRRNKQGDRIEIENKEENNKKVVTHEEDPTSVGSVRYFLDFDGVLINNMVINVPNIYLNPMR